MTIVHNFLEYIFCKEMLRSQGNFFNLANFDYLKLLAYPLLRMLTLRLMNIITNSRLSIKIRERPEKKYFMESEGFER